MQELEELLVWPEIGEARRTSEQRATLDERSHPAADTTTTLVRFWVEVEPLYAGWVILRALGVTEP